MTAPRPHLSTRSFCTSFPRSIPVGMTVLVVACSLDAAPPIMRKPAALADGVAAPADSAVVRVEFEEGSTSVRCSGALITPDLVLTAAHCVTGQAVEVACDETRLGSPLPLDHFRVTAEPDLQGAPDASWTFWSVNEIHLLAEPGALLCGNDIALLRLIAPVDDIEPLDVDFASISPSSPYRVLGYGAGHTSGTGHGIRRVLSNQDVICQGVDCENWSSATAGASARSAPTVEANEFLGSDGACPGDSGGPALFETSKGHAIRALVTRGQPDCSRPIYTRVPTTIRALVRAAALDGAYDTPAWALESEEAVGGAPSVDPSSPGSAGAGTAGSPSTPNEPGDEPRGCAMAPSPRSSLWLWSTISALLLLTRRSRSRNSPGSQ